MRCPARPPPQAIAPIQTVKKGIRNETLSPLVLLSLTLLVGGGFAARPAQAQGLNGQPVDLTAEFPVQTNTDVNFGTQTVTPAGASYNDSGETNILVQPSQVVFTFHTTNGFSFAPFNGYQIAEVGASPVVITGVTLDPKSNLSGFTASDISFDASDIFANFQGLGFDTTNNVTLDITTASAVSAVPEPSATAAFAVGALGLAGLLLRARRKPASA